MVLKVKQKCILKMALFRFWSLDTAKPTDGDALWNASLTESFEDLESEPEQDSICSLDTNGGQEWMPTPQIKANVSS